MKLTCSLGVVPLAGLSPRGKRHPLDARGRGITR